MAQTMKVSGTIVDDLGEPLMAATVQETGTGNGVVTDIDGKFTLTMESSKHTLTISYVGFKKLTLQPKPTMTIKMEEDNILTEMVVTGYTVQRKADLTGAVSVVSVDDMKKQNENNPMKALQGKVPGMNISANGNPSGSATVRIRGVGTLNDNDPLYIIDGVPTKAGMHELNGNDIESIQVLKDAASASIYGSRAANGVIIITTKKGKEGKLKVDFDASISSSVYANRIKTLNAEQWGQAFWQANVNDGKDPNNNNLGYRFDWGYDASGNPQLNKVMMNNYLDDGASVHAGDTDWFNEVSRTGLIQQYNISVSNGSEKATSFFSAGYYENEGTIKETDFNRISVRANNDFKLFDGILTIGENFNMNRTSGSRDDVDGILSNSLEFNPNFPIYAENGEYAQTLGAYSERENPLSMINNRKDDRYSMWRTFGDVHLTLNPFKGFAVRSTFGLDYSQKSQRFFTYPIANGKVTRTENAAESKAEHWLRWMWNAIATYNLEIGKHRGDAMLGMEVNRHNYDWSSAKRYEYAIKNPDYMWPSAGTGRQEALGSSEGFSLVSFFGKVNYTFDNRYLASLTIRRDGSSRFGKNNRYGTFPSASVGWRITNEKFMEKVSWLDDMKLRYSWGQAGNSEISNTARYTLFQSSVTSGLWGSGTAGTAYDIAGTNGGYALTNGFIRSQRGNEDIKWETTTQHNIGIDFAFLKNEIYGSIDWFDKRTKDILVQMEGVAAMGEGTSQWVNAGAMKNTGIEFSLGYRHELANGLSWDINGNIGSYRNEITSLPTTVASKGTFGGNGIESVVGHPMGAQVGYIYDGIFKSQEEVDNHATQEGAAIGRIRYLDYNKDGRINEEDRTWIYNPTPAFQWGLNIYLQYKNFDFTMFWQGVQGVDVLTYDYKTRTDFWANSNINMPYLNKGDRVLDAWTPANADSNIPALTTVDNNKEGALSSYYVENGSYAKLRNIQLGYNLPKSLTEKLKMERFRLFVSGQNLLIIKSNKFSGIDPENPGFGYPIPMSFTFGLNISL